MDIVKKHYPSKNLPKWVNKDLFYAEKLKELQKGLEEFQTQEIEDPSDENPLTFYLNRKFLIPLQSSKLDLYRDCVSDIIDETVIMVATKSKAKKSTAAKKVTKKKSVIASSDDSSEEITKPKVPRPKKVVKKITKPAKKASAKKKQMMSLYKSGNKNYFAVAPLKEGDEFILEIEKPVTSRRPAVYYVVVDRYNKPPSGKGGKIKAIGTNFKKFAKEWNDSHPVKLGDGKYVIDTYQNKL